MVPTELLTTSVATGGEAVARDGDGRVVFVQGALAGERVLVELTEQKKTFARGRVVSVVEAAEGRIEPRCPEQANGCGGCDFGFARPDAQHQAKAQMVTDSLQRLGRLVEVPPVGFGPALPSIDFRTTLRAVVTNGRAGLRRRRSHDAVDVDRCRVAHPLVEELLVEGRYGDAREVTIRVGARTGERLVIVTPGANGVAVPDDVTVVGTDELGAGRQAFLHEMVDGHQFRISADSFFQTRPDGAEALVNIVRSAVGSAPPETLIDLCCGVGLFGATVAAGHVVGVEANRSAIGDARVNLAHLGDRAQLGVSSFERWSPVTADVVIADPSRSGLGKVGVENVAATGAPLVVLVSCDAASLGRDAGLLAGHGYALEAVTLVDMFPDTSHVEVVSVFRSGW